MLHIHLFLLGYTLVYCLAVRSFGTEGRKEGQQIPASDKIYEYILFRGSDIKDLQVKSSPPAQPASLHNDPAIIQSHYPRLASTSTSLPSAASTTAADPTSHNAQSGIQMPPPFQENLPPYQPGASLPSWNSSPIPSSVNGTGLTMPPMYWPGYYTPPSGFPHLQPPPFLRPPHGLTVPQALQQPIQYPGLNASLPAGFPSMPGLSQTSASGISASMSVPASSSASATESSVSQPPNKLSSIPASVFSVGLTPPSGSPSTSIIEPSMSLSQGMPSLVNNKPVVLPDSSAASVSSDKPVNSPASMPTYQPISQPPSANFAPSAVTVVESITLVTPGQLLPTISSTVLSSQSLQTASALASSSKHPTMVSSSQSAASTVSSSQAAASTVSSSQAASCIVLPLQAVSSTVLSSQQLELTNEAKEVKQPELKSRQPVVAPSENKEPLLPAQKPILQKPAGASSYVQYNNRGRGRRQGRGNVQSRLLTKFTEDFDFTAMNEKFNKDEVWGHLCKSKGQFSDDLNEYEDDVLEDDVMSPGKPEVKAVYVKDDFFDSLSCNTIDNGGRNGRIKFSQQRKIDTETFGDSARHRPMGMRGGGRGPRGGGSHGRGYCGRGYGYSVGRGRGYSYPNHQS